MPAVVRLHDFCTGHGCFGPRPNLTASSDVFANSIGVHRVTDLWNIHCCGDSCHGSNQGTGSINVFVNNLSVARVGDSILCGSHNRDGSPNVFAN